MTDVQKRDATLQVDTHEGNRTHEENRVQDSSAPMANDEAARNSDDGDAEAASEKAQTALRAEERKLQELTRLRKEERPGHARKCEKEYKFIYRFATAAQGRTCKCE